MADIFRTKIAPLLLQWRTPAIAAWTILLLVLGIRNVLAPDRLTGFAPFLRAATRWVEDLPLYSFTPNKGFVYSPFAAVCYTPFVVVPPFAASILWRVVSVAILLGGTYCLLNFGPYTKIPARLRGLVYLLIFPLALSNIDAGQANPLVIGLIMIAVAAVSVGRWTVAAVAISGAFYWKLYPLAAGLLLILVAPGKLTWRVLLALAIMALAPFLFQNPSYVAEQYQQWIATRSSDNRLQYPIAIAPLDLWFLAVRVGGLPLSETAYRILQVLAGAAIAGYCVMGQLKHWPQDRVLGGLFAFVSIWMVLLGPASEAFTYLLLAPAVALGVAECVSTRMSTFTRVLAFLAWALLFAAVLRMGFAPQARNAWLLALQPLGALAFLAFALRHYLNPLHWPHARA